MNYRKTFSLLLLVFSLTSGYPAEASSTVRSTGRGSFPIRQPLLDRVLLVATSREPIYLILIEKKSQHLWVVKHDGGTFVLEDFFCATGENSGAKMSSGDSRTPEGIYFITQAYRDNKITIFGDRAFHLDYPNIFDSDSGRDGNGIFIHGTNRKLEPNSTNGCITLRNTDLDVLEQYLNLGTTPIVITDDLQRLTPEPASRLAADNFRQARRLAIADVINRDKVIFDQLYVINNGAQAVAISDFSYQPHSAAVMRGSSRSYLAFTSQEGWIVRKRIWRASPLQIFAGRPLKIPARPTVSMVTESGSPVGMIASRNPATNEATTADPAPPPGPPAPPKPQVSSLLLPLPDGSPSGSTEPHRLPDPPHISVPDNLPSTFRLPTPPPRITALPAKPAPAYPRQKEKVHEFVENWRDAWQGKKIDAYIAAYHPSFRQGDKDLEAWRRYKAGLNRKYEFIKVDIADLSIQWTAKGAVVSFRQEYRSDQYHATGQKTLHLIYDEGWRIIREIWSRS